MSTKIKFDIKTFFDGYHLHECGVLIDRVCKQKVYTVDLMISKIDVDENDDEINVKIYTGRPGLLIGAKGRTINDLDEYLSTLYEKKVKIFIKEVDIWKDDDDVITCHGCGQKLNWGDIDHKNHFIFNNINSIKHEFADIRDLIEKNPVGYDDNLVTIIDYQAIRRKLDYFVRLLDQNQRNMENNTREDVNNKARMLFFDDRMMEAIEFAWSLALKEEGQHKEDSHAYVLQELKWRYETR